MAIECGYMNLIIPIEKIENITPAGLSNTKSTMKKA